jgi:Mlc titration factor MtfA (ptsG expression regulator)
MLIAIFMTAAAAIGGFEWWLRRARRGPSRRLTPTERREAEALFPWLMRLDLSARAAWEREVGRFLARVVFEGCGGLSVTADMKLVIAAQAALLALGREGRAYRKLTTVLLYPTGFSAPTSHAVGSNVVIERMEDRIGESWQRGHVVLAWDEIDPRQRDPAATGNLVFHEFAHQLDADNGEPDGVPELDARLGRDWQRVMGREFESLRAAVEADESSFLDPYGAENPAEFFAVATESFFEEGRDMRRRHPDLYRILKAFYRIDTASLG